jgi:putative SOS response-associated peptidase YedK
MCSRFELTHNARTVAARFGLTVPPSLPNKAEVRPTDAALVIGPGVIGPGRQGRVLHWGLNVSWDKRPLINARAETLAARFTRLTPSRVLVPATSWWEWQGPAKTKMRLGLADGALFAFAGLVDGDRFTLAAPRPRPSPMCMTACPWC